jgi:predicted esterase
MLVSFASPAALAQPGPAPTAQPEQATAEARRTQRVSTTRADLARAYIALERAMLREGADAGHIDAEQLALLQRRFDSASMQFFTGQTSQAMRGLHALHRRLDGLGLPDEASEDNAEEPAQDDPRVVRLLSDSLAPRLSEPTLTFASLSREDENGTPEQARQAPELSLFLRRLYPLREGDRDDPQAAELRWPLSQDSTHTLTLGICELHEDEPFFTMTFDIAVRAGEAEARLVPAEALRRTLAEHLAGSERARTLRMGFVHHEDGTLVRESSRFTIAAETLGTLRARIDDALDAFVPVEQPAGQGEAGLPSRRELLTFRAIAKERAAALSDTPGEFASAEFLADLGELSRSLLEDEIPALQAQENPYEAREGEWVMPIVLADSMGSVSQTIACRVYAPPQAASRAPMPLVIALHGAGGDEAMWLHAYGAGKLRELSDRHGFLVLSPSTYPLASNQRLASSLIEQARMFYTIDDARIAILGHSLGAQAAVNIAWSNTNTYAACLLFAGGRPPLRTSTRGVPTLVVLGGQDPIAPAQTLSLAWDGAAARPGADIQVRTLDDGGHTLLVTTELDRGVEWLMSRTKK